MIIKIGERSSKFDFSVCNFLEKRCENWQGCCCFKELVIPPMTGAMHSSTTMSLEPIRLKPGKIQIVLDMNCMEMKKFFEGSFKKQQRVLNGINQENYNPIASQNEMVIRQVLGNTKLFLFKRLHELRQ